MNGTRLTKRWLALASGVACAVSLVPLTEAEVTHGAVSIAAAENGGQVVAASSEAHDRGG